LLLQEGASPDVCEEPTGRSPLLYAVAGNTYELDTIAFIIALRHLYTGRYVDIADILLSNEASVNLADLLCVTPLMLASANADADMVNLLCRYLADTEAQVSI
jgi:hypothetical protein